MARCSVRRVCRRPKGSHRNARTHSRHRLGLRARPDRVLGPGRPRADRWGGVRCGKFRSGQCRRGQSAGGGSLDDGSLEGGSAGETGAEGSGGNAGSDDGGSLDSESAEDSSLGDLVPESDETCELPDLGGSVAKFYPLFGISGVPSGVVDLVTSALGSFPNLLDVVAGPGGGAALVGQAGSLTGPLCSSIFGGEMVPPPVTVIVDTDGNLLTTVTGTTTPDSSGTAESAPTSASTSTEAAGAPNTGADSGALPTSVPTPGA